MTIGKEAFTEEARRAITMAEAGLEFIPIGTEIDFNEIKTGLTFEDFLPDDEQKSSELRAKDAKGEF